jgi:hypothetical protein
MKCPRCGTSLDEVPFDLYCPHGRKIDPRLQALRASKLMRDAKERHDLNELRAELANVDPDDADYADKAGGLYW